MLNNCIIVILSTLFPFLALAEPPQVSSINSYFTPGNSLKIALYTRPGLLTKNPPFYSTKADSNTGFGQTPFTKMMISDIGYAVRTTVSDFAYIHSSPARINFRSALWVGGILAVGGVIYAYDQEIFDAINRNKNESWYKPVREVGEFFEPVGYMGYTIKYYLGALAIGYVAGLKPIVHISSDILESYFITTGPKHALNALVGRKRPDKGMGPRSFGYGGAQSFPSGHAINIFELATVMAHHVDFIGFQVAAYSIATTVCLQRITSYSHWPSDVYISSIYGFLVAREIFRLNQSRRVKITPFDLNGGEGLGLSITFNL